MSSNEDIKTAFPTETLSTFKLLSDKKFVIPAYQRQYSWSEENIKRLFEDVFQSCAELKVKNDNALLTFLGTIIMTQNSSEKLFNPNQHDARSFYSVVDGQQRLSTVSIIAAVLLHRADFLKKTLVKLKNFGEDEVFESSVFSKISNALALLIEDLGKLISIEIPIDDGETKKHYPRLLRALDDYYSSDRDKDFEFNSALCTYVYDTIKNIYSQDGVKAPEIALDPKKSLWSNYEPFVPDLSSIDKSKPVADAASYIEQVVAFICMGRFYHDDPKHKAFKVKLGTKTCGKILGVLSSEFEASPIGNNEPHELYALASVDGRELDAARLDAFLTSHEYLYAGVLEFIIFVRGFLYRVVFNLVSPSTEDYAFSMFDSLNTTGQVLTAYETFRARMVNLEQGYGKSQLKLYIDAIDAYFDEDAKDKAERTKNVLIAFARASEGKTLSFSLNAQRRYLRNLSDHALGDEARLDLVRHLYMSLSFIKDLWKITDKDPTIFEIKNFESGKSQALMLAPEAVLTLSVLCNAKHNIVIALLLKFYSYLYYAKTPEEFVAAKLRFEKAIYLVGAFSTLYRLASRGTESIDTYYKDLFRDERRCWFLSSKAHSDPDLMFEEIKDELKAALTRKKIETYDKWSAAFTENDVYKYCRQFALYALFIHFISLKDPEHPQVLSCYFHELFSNSSVEHVAPQTSNAKDALWHQWNETGVYEDEGKLIGTIGNLAILDSDINSSLSNSTWQYKKMVCRYLSLQGAERVKAFDQLQAYVEATPLLNRKPRSAEQFADKGVQCFVQEIGRAGAWGKNDIKARTYEIAREVWNYFAPFLDLAKIN